MRLAALKNKHDSANVFRLNHDVSRRPKRAWARVYGGVVIDLSLMKGRWGGLSITIVEAREVFRAAILGNAASIILAHNHPSGDPTPSADDSELTRRLVQNGVLVGIPVAPHEDKGLYEFTGRVKFDQLLKGDCGYARYGVPKGGMHEWARRRRSSKATLPRDRTIVVRAGDISLNASPAICKHTAYPRPAPIASKR